MAAKVGVTDMVMRQSAPSALNRQKRPAKDVRLGDGLIEPIFF